MSLFRGIDFENLEDGEYIQFFGIHILSWGEIERATGIKPTIAFIEDDALEEQIAALKVEIQDVLDENPNSIHLGELIDQAEQALAQVGE